MKSMKKHTLFTAPRHVGSQNFVKITSGYMAAFNSLYRIKAVLTVPSYENGIWLYLEFKAVIVLPTITHKYGNYPYGNYVGNAPVGKVITLNT